MADTPHDTPHKPPHDPPQDTPAEPSLIPVPPPPPPIPATLTRPVDAPPAPKPPPRSGMNLARVFAIGMDFVYGVAGCALLGWLADWYFKTTPRWLVVGAVVGLIVAMYRFIREGLKLSRGSAAPRR